jgi:hypothetical protein
MSEAMTNLEIEDVLSSIRRLVSEDNRPGPRGLRERATADGRLVLTPALRIVSSRPAPLPPLMLRPEDLAVSHREAAAAVEAALPPRSEAWEAEIESPQGNARWAERWSASPRPDAATPPPTAKPVSEAARPEEDDYDLFGPIDEEALRDMIRDILHGELQGALGERITRNVRKLVRAEITRAFATRDAQTRDILTRDTF